MLKRNNLKSVLLALAAICGLTTAPAHAAFLSLDLSDTDAKVGDVVTLDLVLHNPFDSVTDGLLYGFGFSMDFDNQGLSLGQATMGADWEDVSALYAQTDVAGLSMFGVPDMGQTSLLLASFELTLNKAGNFVLDVFSDSNLPGEQGLFYLDQSGAPVSLLLDASTSLNVSAVSEPGALALFTLGLMLAARRRFN